MLLTLITCRVVKLQLQANGEMCGQFINVNQDLTKSYSSPPRSNSNRQRGCVATAARATAFEYVHYHCTPLLGHLSLTGRLFSPQPSCLSEAHTVGAAAAPDEGKFGETA